MSDHLPECPVAKGPCCPWMGDCKCQCCCDILRACEQRVQERWRRGDPLLHEQQRQWYANGYDAAVRDMTALEQKLQPYQRGYDAGLSAARDAVAAQCGHTKSVASVWRCDHDRALAAIDALKGES